MPILVKNGRVYSSTSSGSSGGANAVEMTQAQYNALQSPDPNIIYFITDGTANYPTADSMRYQEGVSVADALDTLNAGLTAQEIAITKNTSDWNANTTKCYRMGNLVILNFYVQGTPSNSKTIATGCPHPTVGLSTSAGSPASVVSLGTNGTLYIQSAGTGTYIGMCLAYLTSD